MKTIASMLLALAILLCAFGARAGTITIHDSTGFVPAADATQLQRDSGNWPFDAHLLVENASSFRQLEDDAHAAVTGPNVLAIAIDPARHRTVVRFGRSTGVKNGDWDPIASAGNVDFRSGNIGHGIEAILLRARASSEATTALTSSNQPPVIVEHGWSTGTTAAVMFLVTGFVLLVIWLAYRKRRQEEDFTRALNENREETAELRSRNIDEADWAAGVRADTTVRARSTRRARVPEAAIPGGRADTATVSSLPGVSYATPPTHVTVANAPPVQQTVVMQGNGGGGSGLLEGMLVADMLERDRGTTVIEREVVHDSPRAINDDAGGSSSSWDSGGSSSSSDGDGGGSDDGGSSSSCDSGSSSSWGGGGDGDGGDGGGSSWGGDGGGGDGGGGDGGGGDGGW